VIRWINDPYHNDDYYNDHHRDYNQLHTVSQRSCVAARPTKARPLTILTLVFDCSVNHGLIPIMDWFSIDSNHGLVFRQSWIGFRLQHQPWTDSSCEEPSRDRSAIVGCLSRREGWRSRLLTDDRDIYHELQFNRHESIVIMPVPQRKLREEAVRPPAHRRDHSACTITLDTTNRQR
jgi:hypothetical protein